MAIVKRFIASMVIFSPVWQYSSVALAGRPYANMQIAAVHFCNADSPKRPKPSRFCTNHGSKEHTLSTMWRNKTCFIRNWRLNFTLSSSSGLHLQSHLWTVSHHKLHVLWWHTFTLACSHQFLASAVENYRGPWSAQIILLPSPPPSCPQNSHVVLAEEPHPTSFTIVPCRH